MHSHNSCSDLSLANYIFKLHSKLSQTVAILCHMKAKVPKSLLNIIYKTAIQAYIDFCIRVWGLAPYLYVDKARRLENWAAHIVSGNYAWAWGTDIAYCIKYKLANYTISHHLLMYRCVAGTAPFYLSLFHIVSHEYFTGGSVYDLEVPMPNCEIFFTVYRLPGYRCID